MTIELIKSLTGRPSLLAAMICLCVWSAELSAANIWKVEEGGKLNFIVIEGVIEKGDYKSIYDEIRRIGQNKFIEVVLRSPGGDYFEAIKIGRLLRSLKIGANVPQLSDAGNPICPEMGSVVFEPAPKNPENCTCLSACAFIFIGAPFRNGEFVGVHRPYFDKAYFSKLTPDEASTQYKLLMTSSKKYLEEMGVSGTVYDSIMAPASNEMRVLDNEYIKNFMWGWVPEIEEWILSKCPEAPPEHKCRELAEKYLMKTLSKKESSFYDAICIAGDNASDKCVINAQDELRRISYKKVYGDVK